MQSPKIPTTNPASLLEEIEALALGRSQAAALAHIRATVAPELADEVCERFLAADREYYRFGNTQTL
jgi:hypothetical protein